MAPDPKVSCWVLAGLLLATPGRSQDVQSEETAARWHLGPFYLTPRLLINTVGLDTNVFFSNDNRRRDLMASGGPGLDVDLPFSHSFKIYGTTAADYLYFQEVADQRRLTGRVGGGVELKTSGMLLRVEHGYLKTFRRPSYEVDDRVLEGRTTTNVILQLRQSVERGARFGIRTSFVADAAAVEPDGVFLGQDLRQSLDRNDYVAGLDFSYALTPKTSLVLETSYHWSRFNRDPSRDADWESIGPGIEVKSDTTLSGRLVGGVRWYQPKHGSWPGASPLPFVDAQLRWPMFAHTNVGAIYRRTAAFSAFAPSNSPLLFQDDGQVTIEQGLVGKLYLDLYGHVLRSGTDGAVTLTLPSGDKVTAPRNDTVFAGSAALLYRFRERLSIGFGAQYANRASTIAYLGVKGFSMGLVVDYQGTPRITYRP